MNIADNYSESLETVFRLKILKLFYADPGSGIFLTFYTGWKNSDPGSGIKINPRSASLTYSRRYAKSQRHKSTAAHNGFRGSLLQCCADDTVHELHVFTRNVPYSWTVRWVGAGGIEIFHITFSAKTLCKDFTC
jgi:hypothetical protein